MYWNITQLAEHSERTNKAVIEFTTVSNSVKAHCEKPGYHRL